MGVERTVVCMSGVGGSAAEWDRVIPSLAAFGRVSTVAPPAAGPLIVVGHSQGGVRALQLAACEPGRVEAVVLASSFFPPARAGRPLAATAIDYGRHRIAYARELAGRRRVPSPTRRGFRQMAAVARLGLRPAAFHSLAARARCPVLVIHGDEDHVVPLSFARAAVAIHPTWTLRELPGAGHRPHRDRPDRWADAVSAWLCGVA
jgi:pimeloyl-ACP methyl ester carboxylesterase